VRGPIRYARPSEWCRRNDGGEIRLADQAVVRHEGRLHMTGTSGVPEGLTVRKE
jgi:hypothetical protein